MVSAQSRDTRKSYLLSTADSKRDMLISPKFGDKIQPRRFFSPKQDSSSLLKIHELTSKGRASEELATPKKFKINHHETPSSKPHNLSLEEKKKKLQSKVEELIVNQKLKLQENHQLMKH